MKNIVMLYKDEDDHIYCQQITQKGKEYVEADNDDHEMWEDGGTITIDDLEEILDRDI